MTQWQVVHDGADDMHVTPIADSRLHDLSAACWCCPRQEDGFLVHNSADGRESFERGERKPS